MVAFNHQQLWSNVRGFSHNLWSRVSTKTGQLMVDLQEATRRARHNQLFHSVSKRGSEGARQPKASENSGQYLVHENSF